MRTYLRAAWHLAIGVAVALTASAASAQPDLLDIPMEGLVASDVQSAARVAKQLSESNAAVSIVTAEDIRTFGYRTLGEVLNSMRGLYTTSDRRYQFPGGRAYGVPGDFAGRIRLLIDGYATQDNLSGQLYLDESGLIDIDLIDRVEYIPGPGGVNYGQGAFFGVINVITKNGRDFNGLRLSGEAGSYNTFRKRATFGKQFDNGADLLLSYSRLNSVGQDFDFPYFAATTGNGRAAGMDGEHNERIFLKFQYQNFSLEAGHVQRTKQSPLPRDELGFGKPYQTDDTQDFVQLNYDYALGSSLRGSTRAFAGQYLDHAYRGYNEYAATLQGLAGAPPGAVAAMRNRGKGAWTGIDQQLVYTGIAGHTLTLGAEYRRDPNIDFYNQSLTSSGRRSDYDFPIASLDSSTWGLRFADELRLGEHWTANVGARYDRPQLGVCQFIRPGTPAPVPFVLPRSKTTSHCIDYPYQPQWSPRAGLVWQADARTTLKASWAEANRMPTPLELPFDQAYVRPERVETRELVLIRDFGSLWRFTGSVYDYHVSDAQYIDDRGYRHYDGKVNPYGAEVQLDTSWGRWSLRGSVAWRQSDVPDKALANSPRWLGKFNLGMPLWNEWLRGGLEAQFLDSRYGQFARSGVVPADETAQNALRGMAGPVIADNRKLPPVTLVNFTVSSVKAWHGVSGALSVKNLLDRRWDAVAPTAYASASSGSSAPDLMFDRVPMDGRSIWLQLHYDLGF